MTNKEKGPLTKMWERIDYLTNPMRVAQKYYSPVVGSDGKARFRRSASMPLEKEQSAQETS